MGSSPCGHHLPDYWCQKPGAAQVLAGFGDNRFDAGNAGRNIGPVTHATAGYGPLVDRP